MPRNLAQLQTEFSALRGQPIMAQNRSRVQLEQEAASAKYSYEQAVALYNAKNSELQKKKEELKQAKQNEDVAKQEMEGARKLFEAEDKSYKELIQNTEALKKDLLKNYVAAMLEDEALQEHNPMEELIGKLSDLNMGGGNDIA